MCNPVCPLMTGKSTTKESRCPERKEIILTIWKVHLLGISLSTIIANDGGHLVAGRFVLRHICSWGVNKVCKNGSKICNTNEAVVHFTIRKAFQAIKNYIAFVLELGTMTHFKLSISIQTTE